MAPIEQLNLTLAFDRLDNLKAGMYCLDGNDPQENVFGDLNLYPLCYGICPNSNVAGFGVRASFYAQTILSLLLAVLGSDYNGSYVSMITAMATSLCLVIAALYALSQVELTLHHAVISINLATLPTMTFFAAIFRLRISQRLRRDKALAAAPVPTEATVTEKPSQSGIQETQQLGKEGSTSGTPALPSPPLQTNDDDEPFEPNKYIAFLALLFHFLFCAILLAFALGFANTRYFPEFSTSSIAGGLKNLKPAQPQCNVETSIVIFFRGWPLLRTTSIPEYQSMSTARRGLVQFLYILTLFAPFFASFVAILPLPGTFSTKLIARFKAFSKGLQVSLYVGSLVVMLVWVAILMAMTEMQINTNNVLPGEGELDFGQVLPLLLILIPLYQFIGLVLEALSKKNAATHEFVHRRKLHKRFAFQLPPPPPTKRPLSTATYATALSYTEQSQGGSTPTKQPDGQNTRPTSLVNSIPAGLDNDTSTQNGLRQRVPQVTRPAPTATPTANTLVAGIPSVSPLPTMAGREAADPSGSGAPSTTSRPEPTELSGGMRY